jgi:hypothetical protein
LREDPLLNAAVRVDGVNGLVERRGDQHVADDHGVSIERADLAVVVGGELPALRAVADIERVEVRVSGDIDSRAIGRCGHARPRLRRGCAACGQNKSGQRGEYCEMMELDSHAREFRQRIRRMKPI